MEQETQFHTQHPGTCWPIFSRDFIWSSLATILVDNSGKSQDFVRNSIFIIVAVILAAFTHWDKQLQSMVLLPVEQIKLNQQPQSQHQIPHNQVKSMIFPH